LPNPENSEADGALPEEFGTKNRSGSGASRGANKILTLRCAVESNAFDDFREYWAEKKKVA